MAAQASRELVRARTDIVELVSAYVTLRKQGRRYVGLCPFHSEKTPSFTVDRERGLFYCFGCGAGGDVFEFVMRVHGLSFPEAVRDLARRAGIQLEEVPEHRKGEWERWLRAADGAVAFFERSLAHPETGRLAREYLERRGVDAPTVRRFRLGYAPDGWDFLLRHLTAQGYEPRLLERLGLVHPRADGGWYDAFRHRLVFPIFDPQGRPVAVGGRALREGDQPKYLNSRDSPLFSKARTLYGLHLAREALHRSGRAVVVEGYMDLVACHQYGIEEAVATLGTALTVEQAQLLRRHCPAVILVYDSDEAGRRAVERALPVLEQVGLEARAAVLPEGLDPDAFLRAYGRDEFLRRLDGALPVVHFALESSLRRHPQTPEGKVRVVDEVLPLVASIRHDVARSEHIRQLSQRLGIPEDAVRARLRALRRRQARPGQEPDPVRAAAEASAQQLAEQHLLQRMLDEEGARVRLLQVLRQEDFTDPLHREVFLALRHSGDVNAVREAVSEAARQVVHRLWFGPRPARPDEDGWVARIRAEQRRRRRAELVAEIARAEQAGELDRVRAMQEELKALVE
ncbi:MAG: DNA primase [Armatimonadota bacterium]|nr:DNA primase [Armatimonadota bacterium]MDR7388609.1 DNA primase [Armatimonadota bacterium]MDR7397190.1 DNA primase [Armatimonadota bacterium]MDR7398074.1 DNA primase [Armatimonadota bacterium]MDR7405605.1 DNA primase [Armatimonadota bacterium]